MQSMSDEQLRSRLLQAYETDPDRSKMGRLRKQYDTIIDLQKGGMSLEKILAVLNAERNPDDCLTMKTFNGYLYLLRKERKKQIPAQIGVDPENQLKSNQLPHNNSNKTPKTSDDGNKKNQGARLERPPGISNAAWSELQVKRAKANRT